MSILSLVKSHSLFHFNATCEMEVGNGLPTYTAPVFLRKFGAELELLPLYLANENDYLLIENHPSEQFLESISVLKPKLPKLFTKEPLLDALNNNLQLNALVPWGWSPAEHRLLEPYKAFCSQDFKKQGNAVWKAEHKDLYSRNMALNLLLDFIETTKNKEQFISEDYLPQACTSIAEVEQLMQKWKNLVVKAPWSSSGRGMIVLCKNDFHQTYKKWINGVIKSQGYAMVEPLLNKVCDLSFHFEIKEKQEIKYLGQASFSTTEGGQYIGNNVQALPNNLPAEAYNFLCAENLIEIQNGLQSALLKSEIYKNYTGVLGIDVLLYSTADRKLKFQPCLEINLRQNMGTVALAIRNLLPENSQGTWQIKYFSDKEASSSLEFNKQMQEEHPLIVEQGKMSKGYLSLIEPQKTKAFGLYLVVD